jgi:hypothetical protein
MGTRSRIGLALGPDQIVSVYCHYDGYIQGNGRELVEHFNTKELVEDLINGGDMSSLYTTHMWESAPLKQIIMKKDDDGKEYKEVKYMTDDKNQWVYSPVKESPAPLYYSERGEDAPPKMGDFDDFLSGNSGEEWCYLFTPGSGWQAWKLGWGDTNTAEYDFVTEAPLTANLNRIVTV